MQNVLADLCIDSEAATVTAMRLARAYDESATTEQARCSSGSPPRSPSTGSARARRGHVGEALECLGGNGYVEESGMPRLYREAPLNSIWEGSGNVNSLDVLRAMAKTPEARRRVLRRGRPGAPAPTRGSTRSWPTLKADARATSRTIEFRARRVVEQMALALQGSLLVRHSPPAVADAFCASRLGGDRGRAYGTLPPGVDAASIIERHRPVA